MLGYQLEQVLLDHEQSRVVILDRLGEPIDIQAQYSDVLRAVQIAPVGRQQETRDVLSLDAYQQYALDYAVYPEHSSSSVSATTIVLAGLAGEAGKALHDWHKIMRGQEPLSQAAKDAVATSLGDALWYIAAAAKELGIPMSQIGEQSVRKARSRQRDKVQAEQQTSLIRPTGRMAAAGNDGGNNN